MRPIILSLLLLVFGCSDPATGDVELSAQISALSAADVVTVHVTISGPGMSDMSADLVKVGSTYRGTIGGIPAGAGRVFTGEAFDGTNALIFQGQSAPITIVAGQTAMLNLQLTATTAPDPFHNHAPVIDSLFASAPAVAPSGTVALFASAHDPDGDALSISWSAAGGFAPADALSTTWTAPSIEGMYQLGLMVTDTKGAHDTVLVTIDVRASAATGSAQITTSFEVAPQVASMSVDGSDRLIPGTIATLNSSSFDPDGDPLTVVWSSDCGLAFVSTTNNPATVSVPANATGSCTLRVDVSDDRGGTNYGELVVPIGEAPAAEFPPVIDSTFVSTSSADNSESVVLRVAAHDPDTTASLSFNWTADVGTIGSEVDSAGNSEVTWTAPSCFTNSAQVSVTITDVGGHATTHAFTLTAVGSACVASCTNLFTRPEPVLTLFAFGGSVLYTSGTTNYSTFNNNASTQFNHIDTWGYNTGSVFTATSTGRIYYAVSFEPGVGAIYSVNPDGTGNQLVSNAEAYQAGIVTDGTYVYWARSYPGLYAIRRVPLAGGAVETIADAGSEPRGLVILNGVLYWSAANDNALYAMPADGSQPRTLVATISGAGAVATDGAQIFVTDSARAIWRYAPGVGLTQLFDGSGASGYTYIVPAGNDLFAATISGDLLRMPKTGGTPTVFTHLDGLYGLTITGNTLYAGSSTSGQVVSCGL